MIRRKTGLKTKKILLILLQQLQFNNRMIMAYQFPFSRPVQWLSVKKMQNRLMESVLVDLEIIFRGLTTRLLPKCKLKIVADSMKANPT